MLLKESRFRGDSLLRVEDELRLGQTAKFGSRGREKFSILVIRHCLDKENAVN